MTDKIHYEPHPVTLERKAELRSKGFVIVDMIFQPQEDKAADDQLAVLPAKKKIEKPAC